MPASFMPSVRPEIFELRPDYCALSVLAEGVANSGRDPEIAQLCARLCAPADRPAWGDAHLEAWRDAYRAFGAKPQRTPSSAEALTARLRRDGSLPEINAVVDLYNALSVRFATPIGGENMDAYASSPVLRRALGSEHFDTTKDGVAFEESVPPGEVVWTDDRGVTCRRWNWRQGVRTRIDLATTRMWFVLERLEPMPMDALHAAGDCLVLALRQMNPDCRVSTILIDRQGAAEPPDSTGGAHHARAALPALR